MKGLKVILLGVAEKVIRSRNVRTCSKPFYLKFRLSNVSGMLIDFCQSVQCYDIQQGTKGIKEGVEDYLESINFR